MLKHVHVMVRGGCVVACLGIPNLCRLCSRQQDACWMVLPMLVAVKGLGPSSGRMCADQGAQGLGYQLRRAPGPAEAVLLLRPAALGHRRTRRGDYQVCKTLDPALMPLGDLLCCACAPMHHGRRSHLSRALYANDVVHWHGLTVAAAGMADACLYVRCLMLQTLPAGVAQLPAPLHTSAPA